jgi:EmrB/QacA subfamily drug resistance transporter
MTQMDSTVVNVSLSTIRGDLHSTLATAQWIVTGYLLALALTLPLNGWLVDRIGAKRLYIGCFAAFTFASLLCGAARTMDELIAARMVQGIAGGLLVPMMKMMIARVAGRYMPRVMGYTVVPILIAPIVGPILAGAILKYAAWPWLFYVNLPVGILGVVLAMVLLPRDEGSIQRRPFDLLGFLLISPGLAAFLYGLQYASQPDGIAALLAGAILMGAFVRHAIRKGNASLIDLGLFKNRTFSTAAQTQFLNNGSAYAKQFLVPLYLITGCALSASQAGWMIAAMGLGMMCSFPLVGFLTEKFGCRAVSVGGALVALVGMVPFLWMVQHQFSSVLAEAALFVTGAGQGTISIPSVSAAYAAVPRSDLAIANTAINIVQRLGGPLATTVVAIVLSRPTADVSAAAAGPFLLAFALLIGLHVLVLGSASRLPVHIPVETTADAAA